MPADDVQHFQQQEPLRRRSGLIDRMLPVWRADGFADIGVMSRKIVPREQVKPGGAVQAVHQPLRQRAAIESVGAALRNQPDDAGQVFIDQNIALPGRPAAAVQIDVGGCRKARQQFGIAGKDAGDAGRHGKPVIGVPNCRRQQLGERHRAKVPVQGIPRRRLARHGHRMRPRNRHQRQPLIPVILRRCAGRRRAAAVDIGNFARSGIIGQDERIAAQPAHRHDGNALHGGYCQCGVKSGAAVLQHPQAGRRRQRRIGADHPVPGLNGAARQTGYGHITPPG